MTSKEQRWIDLISNGEFKLTRAESAYFRYLNHSTEEVIFPNYFYEKDYRTILKPNLNLSVTDKEKLKVFLYCIRCAVHYKFDYLIKKYLDYLKQIDQSLYQELVSSSHEKLEIEVIETSNEYFQATSHYPSNDKNYCF